MQFKLKSIYVSLGAGKSFPNEMRPKSHVATGELYVLIKSSSISTYPLLEFQNESITFL